MIDAKQAVVTFPAFEPDAPRDERLRWPLADILGEEAAGQRYIRRSTSNFLISPIALAGLRPLGQTWAQFMIVWQR